MAFFEKTIATEKKFTGKVFSVRKDVAELSNGNRVFREVVEHRGGVGIVALDGDGCVLLVRQFRYPFSRELLEIPAGKLEIGEDPLDCAKRELSEETGCTAERLVSLGEMYPSPGFCEEVLHIYLALGLTDGEMHLDENELLNVERVKLDEVRALILRNELPDGKTVFGIMKALAWLAENR